jgi:HK97 family phage prohead protease
MSQHRTYLTVVRATGDEPSIVISSPNEDRDGDVLDMRGCVLDNYKRNPVVLFGHDYKSLPVGAATNIDVNPDAIHASWRWLEGDAFADRVKNAFNQGILRAASVGFRPLSQEPRAGSKGVNYKQWELLEFSLVPVPANPEAVRMLKSYGLWSESLEKAGRVLSQVNEEHLRQALEHVEGCGSHLQEVLDALDPDDEIDLDDIDGDDVQDQADLDDDDVKALLPGLIRAAFKEARSAAFIAKRRGRSKDPLALDRIHHHHISGEIDIDEGDIRAAIADVMPDLMREALGEIVRSIPESVALALRQRRGRLD